MAAPDVSFNVTGLRALERNLEELAEEYGPRNAVSALRAPIRSSLRPILAQIQASTPRNTGALAQSARISVRQPSRRDQGPHVDRERNVIVGLVGWQWSRGQSLFNRALAVEFGNLQASAQPVLRPTLDSLGQTVATNFANDLRLSIEKTTMRLGRRAAAGTLRRR